MIAQSLTCTHIHIDTSLRAGSAGRCSRSGAQQWQWRQVTSVLVNGGCLWGGVARRGHQLLFWSRSTIQSGTMVELKNREGSRGYCSPRSHLWKHDPGRQLFAMFLHIDFVAAIKQASCLAYFAGMRPSLTAAAPPAAVGVLPAGEY